MSRSYMHMCHVAIRRPGHAVYPVGKQAPEPLQDQTGNDRTLSPAWFDHLGGVVKETWFKHGFQTCFGMISFRFGLEDSKISHSRISLSLSHIEIFADFNNSFSRSLLIRVDEFMTVSKTCSLAQREEHDAPIKHLRLTKLLLFMGQQL